MFQAVITNPSLTATDLLQRIHTRQHGQRIVIDIRSKQLQKFQLGQIHQMFQRGRVGGRHLTIDSLQRWHRAKHLEHLFRHPWPTDRNAFYFSKRSKLLNHRLLKRKLGCPNRQHVPSIVFLNRSTGRFKSSDSRLDLSRSRFRHYYDGRSGLWLSRSRAGLTRLTIFDRLPKSDHFFLKPVDCGL